MGVWAVVVRETAWGTAGIPNVKGAEKLSGSSRRYCSPDTALWPCRLGSGESRYDGSKSHLAGGVWSIIPLCVCVCVAQFCPTLWTPWTLDDAEARNRAVSRYGCHKNCVQKAQSVWKFY